MQTVSRIIGVVVLLAVAGFCTFGFMATYEYSEVSKRLPWQIGYGLIGVTCLVGVGVVLFPRRK